jgi:hypothetical protein
MPMETKTITILPDQEMPQQAAPVHNGCALLGAAITGDATASPIPIPTMDDVMLLAEEIRFQRWRDQADGFFE